MAGLKEQVLATLPPSIRNILEGGARRELLNKVDSCLLVFDNEVICLESKKASQFQADAGPVDLEALVRASKKLLDNQQQEHSILLLLPPSEFVATSLSLPGVTQDNLVSALSLQAETLLPAHEEPLSLAINPASAMEGEDHVALWIDERRMTELFLAFQRQGLFLAAIKPRILNISEQILDTVLIDSDGSSTTAAICTNGVLSSWQHVSRSDFAQAEFAQQWQQFLESCTGEKLKLESSADYLSLADKDSNKEYSFFAEGALTARKRVERGRRMLLAAAVVAVFLLLGALPFAGQFLEIRSLTAALESSRQMSFEARQDQSVVVNFEDEWGPINDFPEQRVREAMFTLQRVLLPDQLTSLDVVEGLIKIQGTSSEPQAILQRMEQDPMFTEVIFSRATNNSRYYIDLRLATVNFEAYMVRYFPDE